MSCAPSKWEFPGAEQILHAWLANQRDLYKYDLFKDNLLLHCEIDFDLQRPADY